jgi:predicted Rossmann-fold nucleotide-binding protein
MAGLASRSRGTGCRPRITSVYDGLIPFLDHAVTEGFLIPTHRQIASVGTDPDVLLDRLASYQPSHVQKWLKRSDT